MYILHLSGRKNSNNRRRTSFFYGGGEAPIDLLPGQRIEFALLQMLEHFFALESIIGAGNAHF